MTTISTGSKKSNIQDKNSTEDKSCELDENLVKALLVKNQPSSTPRFSQDAISGISKLLHSFIVEARRRALVEAECDATNRTMNNDDYMTPPETKIETEHILRIAAEMLMDYS